LKRVDARTAVEGRELAEAGHIHEVIAVAGVDVAQKGVTGADRDRVIGSASKDGGESCRLRKTVHGQRGTLTTGQLDRLKTADMREVAVAERRHHSDAERVDAKSAIERVAVEGWTATSREGLQIQGLHVRV
jgi:hypothetical protein